MAQFADDLAALLDALGISEPVVLCGLSMGGYIAFQFWRRHAARLRGLILCDTRAAADTPEAAAARAVMAERVLREGPAPLVETMLPRVLGETTRRQRPDLVENVRRMMMAADPRGIAAASRGMAERPDMTASLPQIRCPTLVVVGSRRRRFPARRDARHGRGDSRRQFRRDSRRRPPLAAGEARRGERGDCRVHFNIVGCVKRTTKWAAVEFRTASARAPDAKEGSKLLFSR